MDRDSVIAIEPMAANHWKAVRSIYLQGIASGNATFQQTAPEWKEWDAGHLRVCRLVALSGCIVVGWAALSPVSSRPVYRGVTEVSVYVAETARGCGVGAKLLARLIAESEANFGFRIVGTRSRLGSMNGLWRDVLLLERRSLSAGT
jgi:L-amino acid N-acyltransferase YncA